MTIQQELNQIIADLRPIMRAIDRPLPVSGTNVDGNEIIYAKARDGDKEIGNTVCVKATRTLFSRVTDVRQWHVDRFGKFYYVERQECHEDTESPGGMISYTARVDPIDSEEFLLAVGGTHGLRKALAEIIKEHERRTRLKLQNLRDARVRLEPKKAEKEAS